MRRQRMLGFPVLVTLALVIVHQVSSAQVTNAQPEPTIQNPGAPVDQAVSASEVLVRMDSARGTVRRMLEEARAQRDVIKTLCLDDKLNQIDVAIRSARDRKNTIDGAVKKNDVELVNHETTLLNVLRQRIEQLVVEANTCISKETETVGAVTVGGTMSIDPNVANEPAYYPPGIIIIEPPPTGSVIK